VTRFQRHANVTLAAVAIGYALFVALAFGWL
jgi:hypothetical protein